MNKTESSLKLSSILELKCYCVNFNKINASQSDTFCTYAARGECIKVR